MKTRRIVIVGASGGLGAALAREYAGPNVAFLILGRSRERLEMVRADVEKAGGIATCRCVDITDFQGMEDALTTFADGGGVNLFFLAAGVKTGNRNAVEKARQLERVISVNLTGTIRAVQTLLPHLIDQKQGQLVLFGSLAAIAPQPDILSYSATKAGIHAYGTALRRVLRGTGVSVHVVSPGFVDTPMTDRHIGRTPLKVPVTTAARVIRRGLERRQPYIAFPKRLVWLIRLQNLLPPSVSDWFDRGFRAKILPDSDELNAIEREDTCLRSK